MITIGLPFRTSSAPHTSWVRNSSLHFSHQAVDQPRSALTDFWNAYGCHGMDGPIIPAGVDMVFRRGEWEEWYAWFPIRIPELVGYTVLDRFTHFQYVYTTYWKTKIYRRQVSRTSGDHTVCRYKDYEYASLYSRLAFD